MKKPLSLYIHWAFCKSKCPYCDFNSHVRASVDNALWQTSLLKELKFYADRLPDRELVSIFFGGGTPSLMEAKTVAALIDATARYWTFAEDIEITLEANPTSVEVQKFRDFRKAGVNRVSIGVQSLNPADLAFLGREHSRGEALQALELAHAIFPRMSFDLIYALPGQTLAGWEKELMEAIGYAGNHLSLYQLTIEENTAFHHLYHKGGFHLPQDTLAAELYQLTEEITNAHHLPAYEVSNYAVQGQGSRHNLAYWRLDDYIGIGAGAHGRLTLNGSRMATENIKSPERWLEKVGHADNGLLEENPISDRESLEEAVIMGLRLTEGIDYADWQERLGIDIKSLLPAKVIRKLCNMSLLTADDRHLQTTREGRLLLNSIIRELLTDSN